METRAGIKSHVLCCALMSLSLVLPAVCPACAGGMDALLQKLVEKKILTTEEARELRQEIDKEQAQAFEKANKNKVSSWIEEMKWTGDLRLRAELNDNEDQSNPADRWRYRVRLRLGLETKFQDWAKLGVRLTTGGDDPVGTNQSFQDTFSHKSISLDLAYVTLTPPECDVFSISGGKIPNPTWQPSFLSPMQYDFDVTPEGIAEQVQWRFGPKKTHRLFANFGQYVLDEISGDSNDPYLFDFQGGAEAKFERVRLIAAGGYSHTYNLPLVGIASGNQPAGSASPTAQSSSPNRGNATRQPGGAGTTILYLDDFRVVYGRGEVAWTIVKKPFLGTPALLTLGGEYIHNLSDAYDNLNGSTQAKSPDQTDGWTVQVTFGALRKRGEWSVIYQYKYLEADAVWDALTDSDWGTGGTDREGHAIRGAYNIREWWQVSLTATITEMISSRPVAGASNAQNTRGNPGDELLRVQMDTVFKF